MIESVKDMGQMLTEARIKEVLVSIRPDLKFDIGGNLGIWHPNIESWQGVWLNGNHLASMDRGNIPEYNVYLMRGKRVDRVLRVGWRHTLERVVRKNIGVTWDKLSAKLGVDYKKFNAERFQESA